MQTPNFIQSGCSNPGVWRKGGPLRLASYWTWLMLLTWGFYPLGWSTAERGPRKRERTTTWPQIYIYVKSTSSFSKLYQKGGLVRACCGGFFAGCKHRLLPMITRRQLHNKAKLAFILPNFDGAKRIGPHNWDIISVLVGSLLGDCRPEREKSGGVRFWFKQNEAHKDYIFWLYEFFNKRGYCTNNLPVRGSSPISYTLSRPPFLFNIFCGPPIKKGAASDQVFKRGASEDKFLQVYYRFVTYRYTNLLWLYKLFYNHNKQKKVPKNIADLLSPLGLAVWICNRGYYHKSGIILNTGSIRIEEVLLLSLALESKFNIKTT